jgi:hypothetical protein
MFHELAKQQEFQPGQRHRSVADVSDEPSDIQDQLAGPHDLAALMSGLAKPDDLTAGTGSRRLIAGVSLLRAAGVIVRRMRLFRAVLMGVPEPGPDPGDELGQ